MTIHLFSPLLYAGFVYCVQDFQKIEAPWFYHVRKVYNVCMSHQIFELSIYRIVHRLWYVCCFFHHV